MNCQIATGADPRARAGVEPALDHRDVEEILREPLTLQRLLEQIAVSAGAAQPAGHDGVPLGIVLEVVEVAEDLRIPAHRQIGELEAAQPLRVRRWRGAVVAAGRWRGTNLRRHVAAAAPRAGKRARWQRRVAVAAGGRRRSGASGFRERLLLEAADLAQLRCFARRDVVDGDAPNGASLREASVGGIGRARGARRRGGGARARPRSQKGSERETRARDCRRRHVVRIVSDRGPGFKNPCLRR